MSPYTFARIIPIGPAANTKGSWEEICPAAPFDATLFVAVEMATAGTGILMDVGVGAAGNEMVVVENLLYTNGTSTNVMVGAHAIPILIKKGQRVALRRQARTTTGYVAVRGSLFPANQSAAFDFCTTLGATLADSGGLAVDPGGVAGVQGAWVEFSSGLPFATKALSIGAGARQTTVVLANFDVSVAKGPEHSRVAYSAHITSNSVVLPSHSGPYPVDIPPGTPIAVAVAAGTTNATYRVLDFVLYCFR